MQLKHTIKTFTASFNEPNLVSHTGLVPLLELAKKTGLETVTNCVLKLPNYFGANAGAKVLALVAGMLTGANCITDMSILRHGALPKIFADTYAPSTLGSFLRAFTHGHFRQLQTVSKQWLITLTDQTPILPNSNKVFVDIDDTIKETYGHQKQGSGVGYSKVKGLNALLGVVSTNQSAPIIANSILRKGSTYSARGAASFVTETLNTVKQMISQNGDTTILLRADSAFYNSKTVKAALHAGAQVSITTKMNSLVRKKIETIPEDSWIAIRYSNALFEAETNQWISDAEVASIPFVAFGSKDEKDQVEGVLVVRRILQNSPGKDYGQLALFDAYRFHAVFTTDTSVDAVTADKTHRQHAVIEQVNADLKGSALSHLPSGKFNANAAWLVLACIAFNLTRAGGVIAGGELSRAVTATIRRKLINIPARVSFSARKYRLNLPKNWPWEKLWLTLFDRVRCLRLKPAQQVVP